MLPLLLAGACGSDDDASSDLGYEFDAERSAELHDELAENGAFSDPLPEVLVAAGAESEVRQTTECDVNRAEFPTVRRVVTVDAALSGNEVLEALASFVEDAGWQEVGELSFVLTDTGSIDAAQLDLARIDLDAPAEEGLRYELKASVVEPATCGVEDA